MSPLRYRQQLLALGVPLTLLEVVAVAIPLSVLVRLPAAAGPRLLGISLAVALFVALVLWHLAEMRLCSALDEVVADRHRGLPVSPELAERAYRQLLRLPGWGLLARPLLWLFAALVAAAILHARGGLPLSEGALLLSVCVMHPLIVGGPRLSISRFVLGRLRAAALPDIDPLREFGDTYRLRLAATALSAGATALSALILFVHFFMGGISLENYHALQTYYPPLLLLAPLIWRVAARRFSLPVEEYLDRSVRKPAARSRSSREDPTTLRAYASAQDLPFKLAGCEALLCVGGGLLLAGVGVALAGIDDPEVAALLFASACFAAVGLLLYDALWHRGTLRPLLWHLSARHRVSPVEPHRRLGVRGKMHLATGILVLLVCGVAMFWGFVKYKTSATAFIQKQAALKLEWVEAEVRARAARLGTPPSPELLSALLRDTAVALGEEAIFYYQAPGESQPLAIAGNRAGTAPPTLPPGALALMSREPEDLLDVGGLRLAGYYKPLQVAGRPLGVVVVLYPGYRGRGPALERPLKELLYFFLALLALAAGLVALTVRDFTSPIKLLVGHADEMARGELLRPVVAAAEADEVGRLTFALEEMRRALRERLRSTEELNVGLEREVARRTADLAHSNAELRDALEKLTRAQAELLRQEKMASIGQLVAGIAHEINNPVNAVANTVGPLEAALDEVLREGPAASVPALRQRELGALVDDIRDMIRVIQNGTRRSKEIVQALHSYTRTGDERAGDVDLQRGLDESLELLRHHLKGGIRVERDYGEIGLVHGNAGQLQQVFLNLLSNAVQALAGRGDGRIRISTAREGATVRVAVSDNGPGIAEENLHRIFDPFFTTKEVGEGTGLGLSIVHGIVERHGGTIEVQSTVGEGTTFTVTLPQPGAARETARGTDGSHSVAS